MSEEITVEALLTRIQAHLDERKGATQAGIGVGVPRRGGAFSDDVYERLEEAEAVAEAVYIKPFLTPPHLPLVGGIWQKLRGQAHDLVIFYVNRLAGAQAAFNREIVAGFAALVDELDRGGRASAKDEIASLREEVRALRGQVAALQAHIEPRDSGPG